MLFEDQYYCTQNMRRHGKVVVYAQQNQEDEDNKRHRYIATPVYLNNSK